MVKKKEIQKKVSIYDLYKREKKIKISDNLGRYTEILIKKLTQADRGEAIQLFNKKLTEERERLNNDIVSKENIKESLHIFNKEQIIQGIIDIERSARRAITDLLPVDEEEKNLTIEEREIKQQKKLKEWDLERVKQLKEQSREELEKMLADLRIGAIATIQASVFYDYICISFMCCDPDTNERIFEDYNSVEKVLDKKVIEQLIKEVDPMRVAETDQEVRQLAENEDFLSIGESAGNSTGSPAIMTEK